MRGWLAFALVFAMIIFMMPFVVSFGVVIVVFAAILCLLARLGLFGRPGRTCVYTYTSKKTSKRPRQARAKTSRPFEEPIRVDKEAVWYQSAQEGEIITLPETALKKDDEG